MRRRISAIKPIRHLLNELELLYYRCIAKSIDGKKRRKNKKSCELNFLPGEKERERERTTTTKKKKKLVAWIDAKLSPSQQKSADVQQSVMRPYTLNFCRILALRVLKMGMVNKDYEFEERIFIVSFVNFYLDHGDSFQFAKSFFEVYSVRQLVPYIFRD